VKEGFMGEDQLFQSIKQSKQLQKSGSNKTLTIEKKFAKPVVP
jgi:hypothetical protein